MYVDCQIRGISSGWQYDLSKIVIYSGVILYAILVLKIYVRKK